MSLSQKKTINFLKEKIDAQNSIIIKLKNENSEIKSELTNLQDFFGRICIHLEKHLDRLKSNKNDSGIFF